MKLQKKNYISYIYISYYNNSMLNIVVYFFHDGKAGVQIRSKKILYYNLFLIKNINIWLFKTLKSF